MVSYANNGANVPVRLGIYEKSGYDFSRGCVPSACGMEITVGLRTFVLCRTQADLALGKAVAGDISDMIISGTNAVKTGTTAAPIGGTKIHLDEASFASITENLYEGGYIAISGGTGIGYTYAIKSNSASFNTDEIYVIIHDGLIVALSTDTDIEVIRNPFTDTVTADQAVDWVNIGQPMIVVPAATDIASGAVDSGGYYFWAQRTGPALGMPDADNTVGSLLMVDTDAGQYVTATAGFETCGWCMLDGATVDTVSELMWLNFPRIV